MNRAAILLATCMLTMTMTMTMASGTACAADVPPPAPRTVYLDAKIGGIVTDQTITPAGQDFYRLFTTLWHDKPLNERFNIAMRERPSARLGNTIRIDLGNQTIFQALLPSARGNLRALSERAVDIVYDNIAAAETARLLLHDDDLAGDEF